MSEKNRQPTVEVFVGFNVVFQQEIDSFEDFLRSFEKELSCTPILAKYRMKTTDSLMKQRLSSKSAT